MFVRPPQLRPAPLACAIALSLLAGPALAAPAALADCAGIAADAARLACFDQLAAPFKKQGASPTAAQTVPPQEPVTSPQQAAAAAQPQVASPQPQLTSPQPPAASAQPQRASQGAAEPSYLERHWELGDANKRGTFQFRMHETNYLIAKVSSSPNDAPYQTIARTLTGSPADLSHFELSYQLGFKMKVIESTLPYHSDLWVAYTQKSFWQASNERASSPFRETNYTPEVMLVTPLDFRFMGLRGRFLNLGLVHQSNGQSGSLSRSWNRVYAQVGLERGDFSLLARIWQRIGEPASSDDNPDITRFLGHGDLQAMWRRNGHEYALLTRYNPGSGRGAMQASWAFPVAGKLKGYLQLFSGYGQSLIDYNHHENTFGVGVQMNY